MTMSEYGRSLLGAAIALRTSLERTGNALATPRLADLLETEADLAAALTVLPTGRMEPGADRDRILHELARARQELARCRRLGSLLTDTVTRALGDTADYGPTGLQVADGGDRAIGRLHARG
jgi:hypothetical protein